jgi:hypothetical protein
MVGHSGLPLPERSMMPISDYEHWNEEAPIVWAAENDFESPMCDMTDSEIKERISSMSAEEFDYYMDTDEGF